MPRPIAKANQVLRGWSGYFHYGHCTKVFGRVRWFPDERVRTQLRERYKVPLLRLVWVGLRSGSVLSGEKPVAVAPQALSGRGCGIAAQCGESLNEWGQAGGNSTGGRR
jgi:hypothetical protein